MKLTGVFMTIWIAKEKTGKTAPLLIEVLSHCKAGEQVQFLTGPGVGKAVVQRLRVMLSRSRKRNLAKGKKVDEFTLHDSIYPFTSESGSRHDCVVMWTAKTELHEQRELLDDLMERS